MENFHVSQIEPNNYINFKYLAINTLIYLLARKGEKPMICKGCFNCQLWGELAALSVAIAVIFGTVLVMFT
jgi:hypothetical protein